MGFIPTSIQQFFAREKMPPGADQVGIVAGTDRETSKKIQITTYKCFCKL